MVTTYDDPAARALSGRVDLHCHSTASDGILSPEALVSRAKSHGVSLLALTDHDTLAGLAAARAAGAAEGVSILPGIELTASWGRRQVHIVGLNVDPASAALASAIRERERLRRERAARIAACLEKRGFSGALEGAREVAAEGVLGRPHFARWLVNAGHVDSEQQAFKRYLGAGKAGDVMVEWPSLEETVGSIRASGGTAVLAHPLKYGLTRTRLALLLEAFQACGGEAAELLCGRQNPVQTTDLRRLMERHAPQLRCSLGSDFHRPDQPWRELGCVHLPADVEPVWNLWQTSAGERA
ncbi:PHP domain-containing protein [Microbulbifer sp. YPW16]|uniref:PHP domain-containing protein n=1 Tax=Microbulbifer sp. YPW16 TaxID=2904242 RepID=UPI001E4EEE44|nr:PHP domain-containing protein [Microbulbifer sp. YPW16]UHQ55092.1 PHP domain-containing protein [Microbulbifer sp. YPW16]